MPASISEYTTTDIAAACSAAGLLLVKGGKKTVRGCPGAVGMESEGWVGGKEGGREGGNEDQRASVRAEHERVQGVLLINGG